MAPQSKDDVCSPSQVALRSSLCDTLQVTVKNVTVLASCKAMGTMSNPIFSTAVHQRYLRYSIISVFTMRRRSCKLNDSNWYRICTVMLCRLWHWYCCTWNGIAMALTQPAKATKLLELGGQIDLTWVRSVCVPHCTERSQETSTWCKHTTLSYLLIN